MKLRNFGYSVCFLCKGWFLQIHSLFLGRLEWIMCEEFLDITLVGKCSEAGVNVFRRYGNVWCPWEVGCPKGERAGSNPVTSDLSPHLRHFF